MKLNETFETFLATVSSSIYVINLIQAVDLVFKIIGIISGVIAIVCFIKTSITKTIIKFKEAKKDGVITKEEAKDIVKEVFSDTNKIAKMAHNLTKNNESEEDLHDRN